MQVFVYANAATHTRTCRLRYTYFIRQTHPWNQPPPPPTPSPPPPLSSNRQLERLSGVVLTFHFVAHVAQYPSLDHQSHGPSPAQRSPFTLTPCRQVPTLGLGEHRGRGEGESSSREERRRVFRRLKNSLTQCVFTAYNTQWMQEKTQDRVVL